MLSSLHYLFGGNELVRLPVLGLTLFRRQSQRKRLTNRWRNGRRDHNSRHDHGNDRDNHPHRKTHDRGSDLHRDDHDQIIHLDRHLLQHKLKYLKNSQCARPNSQAR